MDEITLFAGLEPPPPADPDELRTRVRGRLATAFGENEARTGAVPAATGRPRRRRRMVLGAAVAGVAAAAAIVTPIVAPSGGATAYATADYSVQPHSDGTVNVMIKQLRDPAGLQRALRADGVAAYVRYSPSPTSACVWQPPGRPPANGSLILQILTRPTGPGGWFVIHPAKLPNGQALLIVAFNFRTPTSPGQVSAVSTSALMASDRPPVCLPAPPSHKG